jgi:hypothetical protein
MRLSGPIKAPRPSARRLTGDVQRAFVAGGVVVGVCAVGVLLAGWGQSSTSRSVQSHHESAAELRTGSLLVVSPSGQFCRNRMIDNGTWHIRDAGWVDCETALAKSAGAENPGSRLDLIRQSFRGNP